MYIILFLERALFAGNRLGSYFLPLGAYRKTAPVSFAAWRALDSAPGHSQPGAVNLIPEPHSWGPVCSQVATSLQLLSLPLRGALPPSSPPAGLWQWLQ